MWHDFKQFAIKGNVIDMAVGIIIGAAFGTIARSIVDDIIMPPLGMIISNVDFTGLFITLKDGTVPPPYNNLAAAKAAGAVTINYGNFINNCVTFLIVAFSVFMLVTGINRLKKLEDRKKEPAPAPAPATKDCPYCISKIPVNATRCPACTSQLPA